MSWPEVSLLISGLSALALVYFIGPLAVHVSIASFYRPGQQALAWPKGDTMHDDGSLQVATQVLDGRIHPTQAPKLQSARYNCRDPEESRNLFAQLHRHRNHTKVTPTIGFLYIVYGAKAEQEARTSQMCLRKAFGEGFGIKTFTIEPSMLNCSPKQHGGNTQDRVCWEKLMGLKVQAAQSAPFDITVLVDTDVFANPNFPGRGSVLGNLSRWLTRNADIAFARVQDHFNGGFVAFYKGAATERFFACVLDGMHRNPSDEQHYYNVLSGSKTMDGLQVHALPRSPDNWMCRFDPTPMSHCVFIHQHGNPVKC